MPVDRHSVHAPLIDGDWRRLLRFRCTGCGNCCKDTRVMVTDADVRRIMQGTGLPAAEIVRFAGEEQIEVARRSAWWVRLGETRAVMILQRRDHHCTFLDGADRCTIYEHRPVTCREHPLEADFDARGRLTGLRRSDIVACPHEWDGAIPVAELRDVTRWNERQTEDYTTKVAAWNRLHAGPRTRPAFLRYLGLRD